MARIARIKAEGEAFYHVVSRIANKAFLLNNDGKIGIVAIRKIGKGRRLLNKGHATFIGWMERCSRRRQFGIPVLYG